MTRREKKRLENRFLPSLFAAYLGTLLLMSGIHIGLVTLVNECQWNTLIQIMIPVVYWTLVAVGLTVFTRNKIIKTYDQPMKELAKAADKFAHGDFSVYIPPLHTTNRHDYLDLMFLDFNKMVAECFLQALFPQKCRVTSSKLHGEFPQYCISPSGTLLGAGEEPLQAYKVY